MTTNEREWLENEGQPAVRADEEPPVDAEEAYERFRTFDLAGEGL